MKRKKQSIAITTGQALDLLAMTFRAMLTIIEQQRHIEEQKKQLAAKTQKPTNVLKPEHLDLSWIDTIVIKGRTNHSHTDQTTEP